MREYSYGFIRKRLFGTRIHSAACPFPGKYPLRFLFMSEKKVIYHGKFNSAIWRRFWKGDFGERVFLIYDKAGTVLWGSSMFAPNTIRASLILRYFGQEFVSGDTLRSCEPRKVGAYNLYLDTRDERDLVRLERRINTTCEHVRNV